MRAIKGITLIEMLAAIAAGGVILALVSLLLVESARTWRREEREFSARRSGDRFIRDFRRDLRRSLPDGAAYDKEVFVIRFTGELFDDEMGLTEPARHTARYYMSGERDNSHAVREIFINGSPAGERKYEGVAYFSLLASEEYASLFTLEVKIAGSEQILRASIYAPAEGAER